MAKRIINRAKIGAFLLRDVKSVVGSMYRMNAPGAIGYGFDSDRYGRTIARGMFIDRGDKLSEWTYYLGFKTGVLRRVGR